MKTILFSILTFIGFFSFVDNSTKEEYPKSLADYKDFKKLVDNVEKHRQERLVSLNEFLEIAKKENVIILDSRSKHRFDRKHIKGAKHLNFADFTQEDLGKLIPNKNTKILIYCNNNFLGDQVDFMSKVAKPVKRNEKGLMLALNIPTYLNLYGYGYKNVYELNELINVFDTRLELEGSKVLLKSN